jgi:hypothetical protein
MPIRITWAILTRLTEQIAPRLDPPPFIVKVILNLYKEICHKLKFCFS